jgi:O-antigen ligase
MQFRLLILLVLVLFVRPGEIVSGLEGWPIYLVVCLLCTAASFPSVAQVLKLQSLRSQPITVCVLGIGVMVILSQACRFNFHETANAAQAFINPLLFYLLLVSCVDSPTRLRSLLFWMVSFIAVLTTVAVLQYHGVLDVPSLSVLEERGWNMETGQLTIFLRLRGTGIFNDPNDLSLILVAGTLIAFFVLAGPYPAPLRALSLCLCGIFAYALVLTQSRGGLLGFLAGLSAFCVTRLGWRKAALVLLFTIPAIFILFAGRQTSISTRDGTGQDRIQLWAEGIQLFRERPIFGIGYGQYAEEVGLVAHNSFVHCYTELGFLGGAFFVSAFYLAVVSLHQIKRAAAESLDPESCRLRPYLMAMVAAYVVGMLSLSRCYVIPTYLLLGLVTVYHQINLPGFPQPISARLLAKLGGVSVAALAGIMLFVRVCVHYGS